jgi:hypothetical protein
MGESSSQLLQGENKALHDWAGRSGRERRGGGKGTLDFFFSHRNELYQNWLSPKHCSSI